MPRTSSLSFVYNCPQESVTCQTLGHTVNESADDAHVNLYRGPKRVNL